MENTCVLTVLPVIPNWKIYNSVPKKFISYYAILKEKREFEHLLENSVSSNNIKNSCSITDKKIDASNNKSTLYIVFLHIEEKYLLSLNLIVSEKHILRRRNNLLIFLKNISKNLKYYIEDCSIYVKCDENIRWHIFYDLFEFLFVRYGLCTIGPRFYCAIFTNCILKQDLIFLCYNMMDTNNILHPILLNSQEGDVNVSEKNLNPTCKMLSKQDLLNQNDFKDTYVPSNSQNFTLKVIKVPNENNVIKDNVMPKRKIPKLDCFCSEMHCKCHESKWKLHKNISKYNVNCYMDILLKKGVTSTDELYIAQGDANFDLTFDDISTRKFESSYNITENSHQALEFQTTKENDLLLSESQKSEKCLTNSTRDTLSVLANTPMKGKLKPKPESLLKAINLLNEDMDEKENFSFLFGEFSEKNICNMPKPSLNVSKNESSNKSEFSEKKILNSCTTTFNMFQTASGKKVNISETALKTAEKMFNKVMQDDEDCLDIDKTPSNVVKGDEFTHQKVAPTVYSSTKPPETEADKHVNENIDEMLVDNFFEDICFDEKEESLAETTQSSSMYINKCERSSLGKVRKSLGGRRSLKPYSVPKS